MSVKTNILDQITIAKESMSKKEAIDLFRELSMVFDMEASEIENDLIENGEKNESRIDNINEKKSFLLNSPTDNVDYSCVSSAPRPINRGRALINNAPKNLYNKGGYYDDCGTMCDEDDCDAVAGTTYGCGDNCDVMIGNSSNRYVVAQDQDITYNPQN